MDHSIFFAWGAENEEFNPDVHARHDEDIFTLDVIQKEGEFARAIIKTTLNFGEHAPLQNRAKSFISIRTGKETKLLFVGYGGYTLKTLKGDGAEVELISQPYNWRYLLQNIIKKEKTPPYWNKLLSHEEEVSTLENYQDARTSSFYCHPTTGVIKRSDWFCGDHGVDLGNRILRDSLQLRMTGVPLKSCTVRLHAQWMQRDQGYADVSHQLMRAFPGHHIHSFSGKDLKDKWPAVGQNLGRSGYWIVRSKLKKYHDFRQRYYQKFPTFSSLFSLKDEKNKVKKYRLKRSYFKVRLWLGWQYQQKRKEILSLTLDHAVQTMFREKGQSKTIDLYLNGKNSKSVPLWKADHAYAKGECIQYFKCIYECVDAHKSSINFEKDRKNWREERSISIYETASPDASFFLTDGGYQLAECGLEIAKQTLAKSARCIEISFQGLWDDFVTITTDHMY